MTRLLCILATSLWLFPFTLNADESIDVTLHGQGFSVQGPPGASMLEVRLMGPARTIIFEERTEGAPIHWTLSGGEGGGDYRYEAMVVTGNGAQRYPGGFQVEGGLVVVPAPTEPGWNEPE